MHVYKETNDEIKKLPETWFLLKNYAVVFISYTHVCKFILQNPNLFIKKGYRHKKSMLPYLSRSLRTNEVQLYSHSHDCFGSVNQCFCQGDSSNDNSMVTN